MAGGNHRAAEPGLTLRAVGGAGGLTRAALGEWRGLHRAFVGSVERGERNLALLSRKRIATALRTTPAALPGGDRGQ